MSSESKGVAYDSTESNVIAEGSSFNEVYAKVEELGVEDAVLAVIPDEASSFIL